MGFHYLNYEKWEISRSYQVEAFNNMHIKIAQVQSILVINQPLIPCELWAAFNPWYGLEIISLFARACGSMSEKEWHNARRFETAPSHPRREFLGLVLKIYVYEVRGEFCYVRAASREASPHSHPYVGVLLCSIGDLHVFFSFARYVLKMQV